MSAPTLFGLVLAGGHSRRMQRDKATLRYGDELQLPRVMKLLTEFTERCCVSIRADQRQDPSRAGYEAIIDVHTDVGPIGGIHAALRAHPDHAWLVLACDLPWIDAATLSQLIAAREPAAMATAFRSEFDALPEPLCAIWEPKSLPLIEAWLAQGKQCPRALLRECDTRLLPLSTPHALDNINTASEYVDVQASLGGHGAHARTVTVRYFALLREQAGRASEQLRTPAHTAAELYDQLQRQRGLSLPPGQLRVAINDAFSDWSAPLQNGDDVAFLPPVAGG